MHCYAAGLWASSYFPFRETNEPLLFTPPAGEVGSHRFQRRHSLPSLFQDLKGTDLSSMTEAVGGIDGCDVVGRADCVGRVGRADLRSFRHKCASFDEGVHSRELVCNASLQMPWSDSSDCAKAVDGVSTNILEGEPASQDDRVAVTDILSSFEQGGRTELLPHKIWDNYLNSEDRRAALKLNCSASFSLESLDSSPSPDLADSPVMLPSWPFFPFIDPTGHKPNGLVMTDEIREELSSAASVTSQAYMNIRAGNTGKLFFFSHCLHTHIAYISYNRLTAYLYV